MQNPKLKAGRYSFDYSWVILIACFVIGVVGFGTQYSFGVFFKSLESEFGWSRASTSGIFSVYMVLTTIFSIFGGWLLDRYGPRIAVSLTGVFTALGLLLTSMVATPWHVFITYSLFIAIGTGALFPVLMSIVSRWFDKRRGLAVGIVGSSVGTGMMVMAPVAAYLIAGYGWRTSYFIMSIIAFLGTIPFALVLKRAPAEAALRGTKPKESRTSVRPPNARSEDYTLSRALRHRNLWLILFIWLLVSACVGVIMTHIVPHAIDLGIAPTTAALIISVTGGMSVAGKVIMGRVSDNIGRKRVVVIASLIMAVAMVWLLRASNLWMLMLFAFVFGFAYGGTVAPCTALIGDTFGILHLGIILGVIDTGWGIGSAIGPALAGYLFDISGTYLSAFITALAAVLITAVLAIMLRQRKLKVAEQGIEK